MPEYEEYASADAESLPKLLAELDSRDGEVRRRARQSLVDIGPMAVAPLTEKLAGAAHRSRWEAAMALARIADPRAAWALVDALSDPHFDVRWVAAEGLIRIGPASLPPLYRALIENASSVWLRDRAHQVLEAMAKRGLSQRGRDVLATLEGTSPAEEAPAAAVAALQELREQ